jgi:hypothetical protein
VKRKRISKPPPGWTRVDSNRGKFARWVHESGWRIEHCGHPTALWPWAIFDPDGNMHCGGGRDGGNPRLGYAWPNLTEAFAYVAGELEHPRPYPDHDEPMGRKQRAAARWLGQAKRAS